MKLKRYYKSKQETMFHICLANRATFTFYSWELMILLVNYLYWYDVSSIQREDNSQMS